MAAEVMAILRANTADFTAKMGEAKAEMDDLNKGGSGSMEKLASVGKAALFGIAAGAVVVGVAGVKMATDFQASMTQLVTGAGESQKNIKLVSDGILGMAAAVGQTPMQLAAGMYLIESAGYHGASGLTVLKAAAEGAAVGNADLATVAGAVTTALTDYHLKASDAYNVTSALVETVASGKTTVDALTSSLGRIMPLAANYGVSMQTVLGAMATMTNTGLTAKMASTELVNMLSSIESPASTAGKALAAMGLSSQQLVGIIGSGPEGLQQALALVAKAAGTEFPKGSAAYNVAIKDALGGTTSLKAVLALTGATGQQFVDNVKNIGERLHGSRKEVQGFSDVQKDLGFQMKQAEAAGEALLIQIGERLIPVIEKAITVGEKMASWLMKHKSVAEALAIVIGGALVTAISVYVGGLVAATAGSIIDGIMGLVTGFQALTGATLEADAAMDANPIGALILAVMALAAAVYEIVKHWGTIEAFFKSLWKDVEKIFDDAWHYIKDVIETAWHYIVEIFEDATIAGILYAHWRGILSGVETAWSAIVDFFTAIPGRILGALSSLGSDLMGWISGVWGTFESWVEGAWGAQVTFVGQIPGKIITALASFGSLLLSWFETAWNTFYGFVQSVWSNEIAFWTGLPSRLIGAVASLAGDLLSWAEGLMGDMLGGVKTGWSTVSSWFGGLWNLITSAIGNLVSDFETYGQDVINGFLNGLKSAWSSVTGWLSHAASDVKNFFTTPLGLHSPSTVFHQLGLDTMQGYLNGLNAAAPAVLARLGSLSGQIAGTSFGTGGISPIGGASFGGSSGAIGGGPMMVQTTIQIDGQAFMKAIQPAAAQFQRTVPLPIFGMANATVS